MIPKKPHAKLLVRKKLWRAFRCAGCDVHSRGPSLRAHMRSHFVQDDKGLRVTRAAWLQVEKKRPNATLSTFIFHSFRHPPRGRTACPCGQTERPRSPP